MAKVSALSEKEKAEYAAIAAKMMELTPDEVPPGLLRRIHHLHTLYVRHTAHMDLDIRSLMVAVAIEQSGLVPWDD